MVTYKGTLTKYEIHNSHANTALGIALDLTSVMYTLCCLSWIETPIRKFYDVCQNHLKVITIKAFQGRRAIMPAKCYESTAA